MRIVGNFILSLLFFLSLSCFGEANKPENACWLRVMTGNNFNVIELQEHLVSSKNHPENHPLCVGSGAFGVETAAVNLGRVDFHPGNRMAPACFYFDGDFSYDFEALVGTSESIYNIYTKSRKNRNENFVHDTFPECESSKVGSDSLGISPRNRNRDPGLEHADAVCLGKGTDEKNFDYLYVGDLFSNSRGEEVCMEIQLGIKYYNPLHTDSTPPCEIFKVIGDYVYKPESPCWPYYDDLFGKDTAEKPKGKSKSLTDCVRSALAKQNVCYDERGNCIKSNNKLKCKGKGFADKGNHCYERNFEEAQKHSEKECVK